MATQNIDDDMVDLDKMVLPKMKKTVSIIEENNDDAEFEIPAQLSKIELRRTVTITTLGHHCIHKYGEPDELPEKLESYIRGKKTGGEEVLQKQEAKFMEGLQQQIEQQKRQFINGLRDKNGNIPLAMECIICKGLVYQPTYCQSCGKVVFCEQCCDDQRKDTSNENREKCPACLDHLSPKQLNSIMLQMFEAQVLMVPALDGTSSSEMLYKDLSQYFNDNVTTDLTCPQKCDTILKFSEAKEHFKYCEHSQHFCYNCFSLLDNIDCIKERSQHDAECSELRIKCPNKCGTYVTKRLMKNHVDHDCVLGTDKCTNCNQQILRKEMKEHEEECIQQFLHKLMEKEVNIVSTCPASKDSRHKITKCRCSYYCSECHQFLKKGENLQILASKCGILCTECEMPIFKNHPGFKVEKDCSVTCQDCNILYMDFGHNITNLSCECLYCEDCDKILNNNMGGVVKKKGCAICFRCVKSIGNGHQVVGDMNCALYCLTCHEIIDKKHRLVTNEKGCQWCEECQTNRAHNHEIIGDPDCGLFCITCKSHVVQKHNWYISKDGCPYCIDCEKGILPDHEIVGQLDCGLYCLTCQSLIHRNHSSFRTTQCAIVCDANEHNKIYKQLKEGHVLQKDGNYWSCGNCAKKLDANDLERS